MSTGAADDHPEQGPMAGARAARGGEPDRLHALHRLGILDTPPEETFDRFARIARTLFDVPIALLSLIDADRQWFKARVGLAVESTPRDLAFCAHAIHGSTVMEVTDASEDPRFSDNPLVTGPPGIRYYAGAPLVTRDGYRLGTLCLIDTRHRPPLGPAREAALEDLAAAACREIEMRALARDVLAMSETLMRPG